MKRSFLINLFFLLGINLLIKPFWLLGIDRQVQNIVGASEYGLYYALMNLSIALAIFGDLGLSNYNNRNVASKESFIHEQWATLSAAKILLSVLFMLVLLLIGSVLRYNETAMWMLLFIGINQILSSFLSFLRSNISGLQLFKLDSLFSGLDKILVILILFPMLWGPLRVASFQIEWLIFAQTTGYAISVILALGILIKKSSLTLPKFSWKAIQLQVKKSLPYALLIILMGIYSRMDGIMIERMLENGAYEAGSYAAGFRLYDAANMLGFLVAGILLPLFARLQNNRKELKELLSLNFSILLIGSVCVSIPSVLYADFIIPFLYPEAQDSWVLIFQILILGFIFSSGTYLYGSFLTATAELSRLNKIAIIGVVINLILNFWWINKYQAVGASFATLLTQGFTFILQWYMVQKLLDLKFNLQQFKSFILFIPLSGLILFIIHYTIDIPILIKYFLSIGSMVLIANLIGLMPFVRFIKLMIKDKIS